MIGKMQAGIPAVGSIVRSLWLTGRPNSVRNGDVMRGEVGLYRAKLVEVFLEVLAFVVRK